MSIWIPDHQDPTKNAMAYDEGNGGMDKGKMTGNRALRAQHLHVEY